MIELYLLEQLVAFYECGTLTAASQKLLISQPALSRSMKKLEDELGVSLFERSKNKLSLNETGILAAKCAQQVLQQEEDMIEKVRLFDRSKQVINVGSAGPGPLYELLPQINSLFPGVEVGSSIQREDLLLDRLRENKDQIIVTSYEVKEKDCYCRYWGNEKMYLSVTADSPYAKRKNGIHFSDVDGETFLQYSDVGVWDGIKKKMLPHSRFIYQREMDNLKTLIDNSDLPGFVTNITIRTIRKQDTSRVYIPFTDPEATVYFYCTCLKKDASRFEKLFNSFH